MSFCLKSIKRTLLTLLCIVHCALCIDLSAHEEYADSMFRAQIATEQLTDSTLADRLYYNLFKAKEHQIKQQNKEALTLLVANIQLDSTATHPEIYATSAYMIHQILYSAKQYSEAFNFIQLAHQHNPNNTVYLQNLAWMEYGFQQYDLAIKHFKELNKRLPYNSSNIYSLCQIYLQNQQYNKALKELKKYQFLEGHSVQILNQRADIYLKADKPQNAEKEIINYIKQYPKDYFEASFLLANIYKIKGENEKRLAIYNQLNQKYPDNGSVLLSLAQYYKESDDDLYEKYTIDAVKSTLFTATDAVKIIRPVLSGYVQNTDTANISPILNSLAQIYPNEVPIIELKADVYKALKDTTNWRATLYDLRKIKNKDEILDFELVTLAESLQDKQEIYNLTKEGYNKYQNDKWAYYYIISLAQNQNLDTCTNTETTQDCPPVLGGRAERRGSNMLINESMRILPTLTNSNIKSRIYQMVGDTYSSQNQDSLAMAMYDSCLVYDPNNSGALNNVAYNITKQPNPDLKKAEKMAAKALELDPESIYILDTYAWILFLRGDNFLSEFYFDKLLRVEKEQNTEPSIETLYHIGCLYLKTNRIEQAKEMWLKALELYNANPDNFDEKDVIETIQNFFKDNENK